MKYPAMGKNRQYRVTLPELNGGVNYAVPPHLIADNQLSDVKNMWYKDGRLQTRPGLVFAEDDINAQNQGYYRFSCNVGDEILLYDYGTMADVPFFECVLVNKDGEFHSFVSQHILKQDESGVLPEITSVLPIEVSADSSEELSAFDVVLLFGFSDNTTRVFGYGTDEESGGYMLQELQPRVPVVSKGGVPIGDQNDDLPSGTKFEPRNMLTSEFECQFTTNGVGSQYCLSETLIDETVVKAEYTDNFGETLTFIADEPLPDSVGILYGKTGGYYFYVDAVNGVCWFDDSVGKRVVFDQSNVANNMRITASKAYESESEVICNMAFSTWFGGGSDGLTGGTRVFASGNAKHPNLVVWSALNNPLYFPVTNYAYIGENRKRITGFGKQGELLVIFKDGETYCTQYIQGSAPTAEQLALQTSIDTESAQALFPMVQLHPEIGCDCPDTIKLCNNRLVWLNSDGKVYGLFTTGQYSERNVRDLSYVLGNKLRTYTKETLKKASAAEYRDNYLLLIGGDIYIMDYSSSGFSYYSSYSSDEKAQKAVVWYVWDIKQTVAFYEDENRTTPKLMSAEGEVLVIAEDDRGHFRALRFKEGTQDEAAFGGEAPIHSAFKTKTFDFGSPERLKRINPFYLQITGAEGKMLELTYLNGNGGCLDGCAPMMTGSELEATTPMRITPNAVRVREFGIRVEAYSRIEVGSLTMNYSMMGTVR